ncbi:HAD-IA family hydrolase [Xenorhabdus sp. 42]|uniref:HAD-IA family hydrolase n=1 Tax=Xenorhabdus szentirmaii TaxID=290112 RepID=UPI0019935EE1|nr:MULTISPECIES: HAD-IA family hydrolase [unclassified Xenorhabdus]MBD2794388.1 HAD-IA family hydrolase [Xenorhabdus sp. CUL]MBD2822167.1 HAD-IA family hydrolase [Xenorhabdus sp. 42]MBD2827095.1 HAD-IA family hydrolase [Xenorhabdus sp. 5]
MAFIECKAILFDLDGTLVDSGPCIERLWYQWAQENHLDTKYVLSIIHGRTIEETLKLISSYFYNKHCVDDIKARAIVELSQVKSITGAIDFIKAIPASRMAIVTSGAKKISMQSIISAGIPVPETMITSEDISHGKPDPEPYLKAAGILGVQPSECLVFEDADSGIQSALSAGMRVIAIGENSQPLLSNEIVHLDNYKGLNVEVEEHSMILKW